jgi:hypothetical protein
LITGLIGTVVMPRLEKLIGLERAGAWSIWFEAVCLTPALTAFFYGLGPYGQHGKTWNSVLLFGGIALSRIGLWSFDLCQVSLSYPVVKLPDGIAKRTPNRSCRSSQSESINCTSNSFAEPI